MAIIMAGIDHKKASLDVRSIFSLTKRRTEEFYEYIKEQTPELCLEAVKKYGASLEYIKEQSDDICFAVVKKNGFMIEQVKEQKEDICIEAIKENPWSLKFIR